MSNVYFQGPTHLRNCRVYTMSMPSMADANVELDIKEIHKLHKKIDRLKTKVKRLKQSYKELYTQVPFPSGNVPSGTDLSTIDDILDIQAVIDAHVGTADDELVRADREAQEDMGRCLVDPDAYDKMKKEQAPPDNAENAVGVVKEKGETDLEAVVEAKEAEVEAEEAEVEAEEADAEDVAEAEAEEADAEAEAEEADAEAEAEEADAEAEAEEADAEAEAEEADVEDVVEEEAVEEEETEEVDVAEETEAEDPQEEKNTADAEETAEEEAGEEETAEEEEGEEVEEYIIHGTRYYVSDKVNGIIYQITPDDEIGEMIGTIVKGKPYFK